MLDNPKHGYTSAGNPVHGSVHDHLPEQTRYQRFNKRLATALTGRVGTMTCFWLFCGLSFLSLPAVLVLAGIIPETWIPKPVRTFGFSLLIAWICQNFIQLILLPALMVGQNLQNQANDARSTKMFENVEEIRLITKGMQATLEKNESHF
jgi:hypothetical protein